MNTILITGANGFVGSNLYDALSADFHLIGLDITGPGKYPPGDLFGWDDQEKLPPGCHHPPGRQAFFERRNR